MYPLTKHTLHQMFNNVKLQVDYECEMAYELLRLVKKQLKEGYGRIVGIKSLLEVTAVKVLVTAAKYKLVLLYLTRRSLEVLRKFHWMILGGRFNQLSHKLKVQAAVNEEESIAREKEEDNAALIAQWNDIQDKVEADYELTQRLQVEEQEELTIKEKVNTFVDMDTELVGGSEVREEGSKTREDCSSKRTGEELESDKSKKQKLYEKVEAEVDDAKEAEELNTVHTILSIGLTTCTPLTKQTLHQMFNNVKLQVDYECGMAYELLRLVKNSLRKAMYINEVFGSILLVIMKLLMKKLDDFKDKYQV
ncbi:hypothetical protein Tco_1491649 [Tanacetum coccineum]